MYVRCECLSCCLKKLHPIHSFLSHHYLAHSPPLGFFADLTPSLPHCRGATSLSPSNATTLPRLCLYLPCLLKTTPVGTASKRGVGAFSGPTHKHARSCNARRSSMQRLLREAVRPVRGTGQSGCRGEMARSDERSPGRDPVRASTRMGVLGSVGHLGRLQIS